MHAWRDTDAQQRDPGARRHRLLAYGDFADLCARAGVHVAEMLAQFLHDTGMVFHRQHLFDGHLVMDQSWALEAVCAVFTRVGAVYQTLNRLGGRFTRSLLDALLWRQRGLSADDQHSLLCMMQTAGICFIRRQISHK